jgi:hypothetical protein
LGTADEAEVELEGFVIDSTLNTISLTLEGNAQPSLHMMLFLPASPYFPVASHAQPLRIPHLRLGSLKN